MALQINDVVRISKRTPPKAASDHVTGLGALRGWSQVFADGRRLV